MTQKLQNLLLDSYEAMYWMGFLMADGYFSEKNRLQITIAKKDELHLNKLADFIGVNNVKTSIINGNEYVGFSIMSKLHIGDIKSKYKIHHRKTYNPCCISHLTEEQMFALSIGFIDGDGSIGKQHKREHPKLVVKCHSSWLDNMKLMYPQGKHSVNSSGYAQTSITDTSVLNAMRVRAEGMNLPLMSRKWDAIDLEFESREQKTKRNLPIIKALILAGFNKAEIARALNYDYTNLHNIIERHKLEHICN